MAFNFVCDRIVEKSMYPAVAQWQATPYSEEWKQFGQHWPHTVPVDLEEYCLRHQFPVNKYQFDQGYPANSYYIISLGFFSFDVDYFGEMHPQLRSDLRDKKLRTLFYYHEGDNPYKIKERLDALCATHNLPIDCYRFVSGNTEATKIPGFIYFPDHELLYWSRGRRERGVVIHTDPRPRMFTALNRTHKWWRATAMTDLWRNGLLDRSFWSYRTDVDCGDVPENNPIELLELHNIQEDMQRFLSGTPYVCDDLDSDQHNNHHFVETEFYTQSYCSIVLETHFDADASGGAFITEKTFKAIKHGHPFVIVGCAGTLETLRQLGYSTFDRWIDNSYDTETNNTQRWKKVLAAIKKIHSKKNTQRWFECCRDEMEHNQRLFSQSKFDRLNTLHQKLYETC